MSEAEEEGGRYHGARDTRQPLVKGASAIDRRPEANEDITVRTSNRRKRNSDHLLAGDEQRRLGTAQNRTGRTRARRPFWTAVDDEDLLKAVIAAKREQEETNEELGQGDLDWEEGIDWEDIAKHFEGNNTGKTPVQCYKRYIKLNHKVDIPGEGAAGRAKGSKEDVLTWGDDEITQLSAFVEEYGDAPPRWNEIAQKFPDKTAIDCLTKWQTVSSPPLIKGKGSWTVEEDSILREKRRVYGRKWAKIASFLPGRQGKQCRERFVNHLDPDLKKGNWTDDEEAILIALHERHGNKWASIAKHLPGRSDNDVKNHWYSTIQRKFQQHGKEKLISAAIEQVRMMGGIPSSASESPRASPTHSPEQQQPQQQQQQQQQQHPTQQQQQQQQHHASWDSSSFQQPPPIPQQYPQHSSHPSSSASFAPQHGYYPPSRLSPPSDQRQQQHSLYGHHSAYPHYPYYSHPAYHPYYHHGYNQPPPPPQTGQEGEEGGREDEGGIGSKSQQRMHRGVGEEQPATGVVPPVPPTYHPLSQEYQQYHPPQHHYPPYHHYASYNSATVAGSAAAGMIPPPPPAAGHQMATRYGAPLQHHHHGLSAMPPHSHSSRSSQNDDDDDDEGNA